MDFSLGGGFAHVVDNVVDFPREFVQHVMAGMSLSRHKQNSKESLIFKAEARGFRRKWWVLVSDSFPKWVVYLFSPTPGFSLGGPLLV